MATVVKVFAGEYDLTHQARLRAEFDALHAENSVVLDMSAVTYLDSTFISELIRLHEKRVELGCDRLTIVRAAPIVKKVFALLYIFTFARVVATLEEALPNDGTRVILHRACSGDNAPRYSLRGSRTQSPTPAWISSVLNAAGVIPRIGR
jgi:anti-anti-sigma regulatory factor